MAFTRVESGAAMVCQALRRRLDLWLRRHLAPSRHVIVWLIVASDTLNLPPKPQLQPPYLHAGAYATEIMATEEGNNNVISPSASSTLVSCCIASPIVHSVQPMRLVRIAQ